MKTVAYLLVAVLFFLLLPVPADALQSGSMRCRNGIVSMGDTIADVLKKCGPPAFQDRRDETSSYGPRHARSYSNVTVDDWTYNFGPQEFMYAVTFRNGRVSKIESLDMGYREN